MDPALRADWSKYHPSTLSDWCPACGQSKIPGKNFCGVCTSHMDTAVLRICRSLLLQSTNAPEGSMPKPGSKSPPPSREMAVFAVGQHFPIRFAQLVSRHADTLRKAGAWFAHVIAYRYIVSEILAADWKSPEEVYAHPGLKMIRDQAYELIYQIGAMKDISWWTPPDSGEQNGKSHPELETLNTLYALFACQDTGESGARHTVYDMIADLERRGKLKVYRGNGVCTQCGISIPQGSMLCSACQRSEQAMARLSITKGDGLSQPKPEAPSTPDAPSRMHIKTD